jgi:hypothetical protein
VQPCRTESDLSKLHEMCTGNILDSRASRCREAMLNHAAARFFFMYSIVPCAEEDHPAELEYVVHACMFTIQGIV